MANQSVGSTRSRSDHTVRKRQTKKRAKPAIDLEKAGREVEPVNALTLAKKEPERINLSRPERIVSILGGAALAIYGISRRDWPGLSLAVVGGGLAFRGITGHCSVYDALDVSTASDSRDPKGVHVEESIVIDKSAEELYGFWRDFENHALISDYLDSVKITGDRTSHWTARGPGDRILEWDAEVINDRPNELIAWQTLPGGDIEHAGSVLFIPVKDGSGTEVHVTMQYYPPAGRIGAGIAMLLHREPSIQTADTLKRLKRLMETGSLFATKDRSHGRGHLSAGILQEN